MSEAVAFFTMCGFVIQFFIMIIFMSTNVDNNTSTLTTLHEMYVTDPRVKGIKLWEAIALFIMLPATVMMLVVVPIFHAAERALNYKVYDGRKPRAQRKRR